MRSAWLQEVDTQVQPKQTAKVLATGRRSTERQSNALVVVYFQRYPTRKQYMDTQQQTRDPFCSSKREMQARV